MSYDRLAPTISSKAKKLFGSGNMGQNNWGGARPPVPLSDGLDTRPCKILDPRLHCRTLMNRMAPDRGETKLETTRDKSPINLS